MKQSFADCLHSLDEPPPDNASYIKKHECAHAYALFNINTCARNMVGGWVVVFT